jgi:dCMP deaminase
VSLRSHDAETKVGSILVSKDNGAIIATGFNGFVKYANDEKLPNTRPEKYEFILHSEINLITNCAKLGISMNNCIVYCTLTPCAHCMRVLWQTGITEVIAKSPYKDYETLQNQCRDLNFSSSITEEGYIYLKYFTRP